MLRAMEAYIKAHTDGTVCEALNEIYTQEDSALDKALARMQLASVPREDW
ncbi:MAG: hypothetical protein MN733_19525 [Nitrososphaera sp.]|nr:hypothetical protein [Nitrososphaera sp.]